MSEVETKQKALILLDLEETLIESFQDALILEHNIRKIREAVESGYLFDTDIHWDDVQFGWMSWAIWDWSESEKQLVDDLVKFIDREHNWNLANRISDLSDWSMDSWVSMLLKHEGLRVERNEVIQLFTKVDFLLKCRNAFTDFSEVILFDDTVEHDLTISRTNCTIIFQNIKEMT